MRLTSIQQLEYQGAANYIGLHVLALALGGIYLRDKFDIFAWQRWYFEYVWDSETLK